MNWEFAPDIKKHVVFLAKKLSFDHLNLERVFCFRSYGSKSRAIARIWALPRIWQQALEAKPAYCLEVISERFDRLAENEQKKVLIHEFCHIPKNFSGTLLSHRRTKNGRYNERIEKLFQDLWK